MRDNLLKEAIADAKTIRDTAIANAKLSLEEAFKPHLASIISTRLRNEAAITEDNDASSEIGATAVTTDNPGPKHPSKAASASSHIENPGQEVTDLDGPTVMPPKSVHENDFPGMGDDEEELDLDLDLGGDEAEMNLSFGDEMGGDIEDVDGMAPEMGAEEPEEPSDLDLEAIIRELEMDVDGHEEEMPAFESFQDVHAGKEVDGAFDGSLKETVAGDGDEGVHKDGKHHKSVDGVPGGKEVKPGQEVTGSKEERMMEGGEIDLDEILREIEAEEERETHGAQHIAKENVELKRNLREHREVIQYLRGKLQEVNMLNAKLLFTNKLFKSFEMNGSQKMKVVETFDRATTMREVKLIYSTLAESFGGKRTAPVRKTASRITEGMASKPVGSTKPKTAPILAEGNDLRERFMKLAHIKKSN